MSVLHNNQLVKLPRGWRGPYCGLRARLGWGGGKGPGRGHGAQNQVLRLHVPPQAWSCWGVKSLCRC